MGVLKALSLAIVAFFCFSSSSRDHVHVQARDFDSYKLVLMWPMWYCEKTDAGCCFSTSGAPAVDFTIYGLWTYNSTAEKTVRDCSNLSFDIDRLSSLQFYLSAYWSRFKCPSNSSVSLWEHAWKTYGACSGLCQREYFETALELKNKANVLSVLVGNGFVPSSTKLYKLVDIKTLLKQNLKVEVDIDCRQDKMGQWQLFRVFVCVDADGSTLISCPSRHTCGDEVSFPPFTYDMLKLAPKPSITKTTNIAANE